MTCARDSHYNIVYSSWQGLHYLGTYSLSPLRNIGRVRKIGFFPRIVGVCNFLFSFYKNKKIIYCRFKFVVNIWILNLNHISDDPKNDIDKK